MKVKYLRLAASALTSVYEGLIYFLSFSFPVLCINHFRSLHVLYLLAMAILGIGFAGCVFLVLLVASKRLLIGDLLTGNVRVESKNGQKWFLSAMLIAILYRSPFRSMCESIAPMASWFFRGMGARMPDSTFLGADTICRDPWFLELGKHVSTGTGVLILGHITHEKGLILERVVIGDHVVIGARSVIFPDVRIGHGARVGTGAVVVRGTRIPDGETWAGIPARKLQPSADRDRVPSADLILD
jgi:acetyltransferase-like isoleucine patch superfamily enzyme